jgi:endonuclease YncB( thermonuclease family)
MSFFLIKGTFHVKGYSPDGDSVRFRANNSANWKKLSGPAAELNARGHAQLRMEAVDALETHYEGYHQPLKQAKAAGRFLLSSLGINEVVWNENQGTVIKAQDGTKGYILARCTERNRRPVAFVFSGETEQNDGEEVLLDANKLKESLNYKLITRGLAYPTYYNGLFSDLRNVFTEAMIKAKAENRGLWPYDRTTKGFPVSDLATLTEDVAILPKLFRRIMDYMGNGGKIDGFKDHLLTGCEPVVRIEQVHFTRLDAIVQVKGDKVRMAESPENLIFLDKVMCKKS